MANVQGIVLNGVNNNSNNFIRIIADATTTGARSISLEFIPDFICVNYIENNTTYTSLFFMYDSNISNSQYRIYQYGTNTNSLTTFDSTFSLSGTTLTINNSAFGKGNTSNSHCMIAYGKY